MKIYIAGRITGDEQAKEKFKAAEEMLTKQNHVVLNPVKNIGFDYKEYIDMGLCELSKCEAIYILKGWEQSKGAVLEHHYANVVGMQVIYEEEREI